MTQIKVVCILPVNKTVHSKWYQLRIIGYFQPRSCQNSPSPPDVVSLKEVSVHTWIVIVQEATVARLSAPLRIDPAGVQGLQVAAYSSKMTANEWHPMYNACGQPGFPRGRSAGHFSRHRNILLEELLLMNKKRASSVWQIGFLIFSCKIFCQTFCLLTKYMGLHWKQELNNKSIRESD